MLESENIKEKLNECIKELNEKTIVNEIVDVKKIYVELGFIKSIMLGILLLMNPFNEKTYSQFVEVLQSDKFRKRLIDDPKELFPFLGVTREDIFKFLSDNDHDKIFCSSPSLVTEYFLLDKIETFKFNKDVLSENKSIFMTINVFPLVLSDKLIDLITKIYSLNTFAVDVEIISEDYSEDNKKEILSNDAFFIYNLLYFSNSFKEELDNRKFLNKHIFAIKLMFNKPKELNEDVIDKMFELTETSFNFASNFEFIDPPECFIDSESS